MTSTPSFLLVVTGGDRRGFVWKQMDWRFGADQEDIAVRERAHGGLGGAVLTALDIGHGAADVQARRDRGRADFQGNLEGFIRSLEGDGCKGVLRQASIHGHGVEDDAGDGRVRLQLEGPFFRFRGGIDPLAAEEGVTVAVEYIDEIPGVLAAFDFHYEFRICAAIKREGAVTVTAGSLFRSFDAHDSGVILVLPRVESALRANFLPGSAFLELP